MTADADDTAAADGLTTEDLYAERAALLDALAALPPDDPDGPERWGRAGQLSYVAFLWDHRPDDLRQAAEAFERAFAAPGDSADWALWRAAYAQAVLCQYTDAPEPALLDTALRLHEEAAAHAAALDPAVLIEIRTNQGYLCLERLLRFGGGPAAAEAAAAHYGAVLAAADPSSDLPNVRYSRGLALMEHAWAALDRTGLEEARGELVRALSEARQRPGDPPEWAQEAAVRAATIRVVVWSAWPDPALAAAAEAEALELLADPETEQALHPRYLDGFARVLYEGATLRGDAAGRERAVGLVRRAVTEWRPERDGRIAATAFFLGLWQQSLFQDDPAPRRVRDVAESARLLFADEGDDELGRRAKEMGRVWVGWARFMGAELGLEPENDGLFPGSQGDELGLDQVIQEFMNALEEGRTYIDHSRVFEGFPGMSAGSTGLEDAPERLDRAFAAWLRTESEEERATVALEILPYLTVVGQIVPIGPKHTYALIDCVLSFRPDDPDWQRRAHAVVASVRLREETAGGGDGLDEVIDHFARATAGPGEDAPGGSPGSATTELPDSAAPADERHRDRVAFGRMQAFRQRGLYAGTGDDRETARVEWERLRESPHIGEYTRRVTDAHHAALAAQEAAARGDLDAVDRHIGDAARAHDALVDDHPGRAELGTLIENVLMVRDALAASLGRPAAPPPVARLTAARLRTEARRLPRDRHAWVLGDQGLIRFARARDPLDPDGLQEAMGLLREAYELSEEGGDDWLRYGAGLGVCQCTVAESERDPAARARGAAAGLTLPWSGR
ncbi:hypothetical protein RB200_42260 [Streptomyces sp. PmtG]